ncbi:MAG: ABC transporter substrate-binding protein [Rhizobiaceae bacterium]|nr:ABC transporter substrate-binding protein [Rhizobiaceae bacterium]
MDIQREVEGALEAYQDKRIGRREFLKLMGAAGVTATAAGQLLASSHEAKAQGAVKGGTLVEGYDRSFNPLDPIKSPWADPGLNAIYEPLVVRDLSGNIVPFLALSYAASDADWRFKIPQNRTYQSGAPVTADAIARTVKLLTTPKEAQNSSFYSAVSDVKVDGEDVVIALSRPKQGLGEVLATEYAYMANIDRRAEVGPGNFGAQEADGTGPFVLKQYTTGSKVRVERWDAYPGQGAPFFENKGAAHLDAVEWVPILEPAQRAAEIETGSVNALKNPAAPDVARLKSNAELVVLEFPETSNFFLLPSVKRKDIGFDDARVRSALSQAIDREGIVAAILSGGAEPTPGPSSSGWKYYEPKVEEYNAFDPDAAGALLDEAGWKLDSSGVREKDGVKLEFTAIHIASPIENQVMAAIAAMFADIGVIMHVESLEQAAFREKRPTADMFGFKWLWSVPADVIPLFVRLYQDNEHPDVKAVLDAFAGWENARTEEDLAKAASEGQLLVARLATTIPVYTPQTVWVHHKSVHGWRPNAFNLYPFYNDVWIEKA